MSHYFAFSKPVENWSNEYFYSSFWKPTEKNSITHRLVPLSCSFSRIKMLYSPETAGAWDPSNSFLNLCIGLLLAVVCPCLTSWTSSLQRSLFPGHHHRHGAHHEHVYGGAVRRHRHGESKPSHSHRGSLPSSNLRRLMQSRCGLHRRGPGSLVCRAFVHGQLWQHMVVFKVHLLFLAFV